MSPRTPQPAARLSLNHSSPIPLYHQIAEAIRYQIATGAIRPQTVLPPLREAARLWGANLHTVRRAYAELAADRIVETRVPHGTVVLPPADPPPGTAGRRPALDRFLRQVVAKARKDYGLQVGELVRLLGDRADRTAAGAAGDATTVRTSPPEVYVAECSETQSRDLAAQLMSRWRVAAVPWPIERPEPPAGTPIVATYFHYRDIAHQWPDRLQDVRFLAIRPDPALGNALRDRFGRARGAAGAEARGRRTTLLLCERDSAMLSNIKADLAGVLPADRFRIEPQLVSDPSWWLARRHGRHPVLFSPRLWGELDEPARSDRRAVEVRYVFDPRELDEIGPLMGWVRS